MRCRYLHKLSIQVDLLAEVNLDGRDGYLLESCRKLHKDDLFSLSKNHLVLSSRKNIIPYSIGPCALQDQLFEYLHFLNVSRHAAHSSVFCKISALLLSFNV